MSVLEKLSEKDRVALIILFIFFAAVSLYFGVRYSFDYRNESITAFRESRLLLMDIRNHGRKISVLEASEKSRIKEGLDQTLLTLASTSAKEKKIVFKRFQPDGENLLQLWLEETNFNALLWWLTAMENKYGIRVAQISVERTKRDGFVNARITLMR